MPYSNNFKSKTRLSRIQIWQKWSTINEVLLQLDDLPFTTVKNKNDIRHALKRLSRPNPNLSFERIANPNKRFPDDGLYYNMSSPTYLEPFTKLYSALDSDNSASYNSGLLDLRKAVFQGYSSCDREGFEKDHNLTWTD